MALLQALTDPFNQNVRSGSWSQSTSGSITLAFASTGASIVFPASSVAGSLGQLFSSSRYDLTSSYGYMQVLSVSNGGGSFSNGLQFYLATDNSQWVAMVVGPTGIFALKRVSGVQTTVASTTYDPVAHKYWKIRESAGTTYWETSSDGISYSTLASQANPIPVTDLKVSIYGQAFSDGSNLGTFKFNNFNVIPSPNTGAFLAFF